MGAGRPGQSVWEGSPRRPQNHATSGAGPDWRQTALLTESHAGGVRAQHPLEVADPGPGPHPARPAPKEGPGREHYP